MNVRKSKYNKNSRKTDVKTKVIKRQVDEIEALKEKVSLLEVDCKKKDELIASINLMRVELAEVIENLDDKRKEYDKLIAELKQMRKVMSQEVFKGRWKIIRLLMR